MTDKRWIGFPLDGNNKHIDSSTIRKIIVIKGNDQWQDLVVPFGFECKTILAIAHRGNIADTSSLGEGLQYIYRTDGDCGPDEWVPMVSGSAPFAGQSGQTLGQVLVQTDIWLTVMLLT